ncbi:GIY-YIG nuclease family protein [Streptomyces eurythermus]|uniref:GIY-YIG nuclease family protein n=2 Tax=Streptomyces TaxID=1883 RepID=UPI0033DD61AD
MKEKRGAERPEITRCIALLEASPLAIDGSVPYRPSHSGVVPHQGGVYLVHDMRGCLYIGRSDCIIERFNTHYEYSHNRHLRRALRNPVGVIQFSWLLAEGQPQKHLEQQLIRSLHPLCNDIRYVTKEA